MNRQQRRKFERMKKDKDVATLVELSFDKGFIQGQMYNNHEWAIRLERIKQEKGIGPKTIEKIFRAVEKPLTAEEIKQAKESYKKELAKRERDQKANQKAN